MYGKLKIKQNLKNILFFLDRDKSASRDNIGRALVSHGVALWPWQEPEAATTSSGASSRWTRTVEVNIIPIIGFNHSDDLLITGDKGSRLIFQWK
jgi:hypothetical protein